MYTSVAIVEKSTAELEAVLRDLDSVLDRSVAALHVQWAIDLLKEEMEAGKAG